jgi:hypothetical protein
MKRLNDEILKVGDIHPDGDGSSGQQSDQGRVSQRYLACNGLY